MSDYIVRATAADANIRAFAVTSKHFTKGVFSPRLYTSFCLPCYGLHFHSEIFYRPYTLTILSALKLHTRIRTDM